MEEKAACEKRYKKGHTLRGFGGESANMVPDLRNQGAGGCKQQQLISSVCICDQVKKTAMHRGRHTVAVLLKLTSEWRNDGNKE